MKQLIVLRSFYLVDYYLSLRNSKSKSYRLAVVTACASGIIHSFSVMFQLFFASNETKSRLPFESILLHGLSYEEWLTAKMVKEKVGQAESIARAEQALPEDLYLLFLLILSFSELVEYRLQNPAEISDVEIVTLHQSKTLSRLVYYGAHFFFRRKKLGPKTLSINNYLPEGNWNHHKLKPHPSNSCFGGFCIYKI